MSLVRNRHRAWLETAVRLGSELVRARDSGMAPSVPCRFHWLTWIGSDRKVRCIAQPDGMLRGDLLDRLAATDRLHGDPGLDGTVGAAFAQLLRRRLRLRWKPTFKGAAPPQMLTMGAVQKSQTTSRLQRSARCTAPTVGAIPGILMHNGDRFSRAASARSRSPA